MHSNAEVSQLDKDRDVRKKFFLYACELYYACNDDSSAEIQLLFDQRRYLSYITQDKTRSGFGPGGDYYPAPATCQYLEEVFKALENVKYAKAVDVTPSGETEWKIILVYKGDKVLADEAVNNLKEYGPTGANSLMPASGPLLPPASQTNFWSKAKSSEKEDGKKPDESDRKIPQHSPPSP